MSAAIMILGGCASQSGQTAIIDEATISGLVSQIETSDKVTLERGIRQAMTLWRAEDGDMASFRSFVLENYAATAESRKTLFEHLSRSFEHIIGASSQLWVDLSKPVTIEGFNPISVDETFAAYSTSAHFSDDMFANKIAFVTILNFPHYTLSEKNELGAGWTREEWAFARMGDMFTARVPAKVQSIIAREAAKAESYIASYNIKMNHLLTEDGRRIFPEGMSLLSHWNLRDQIKSDYALVPYGHERQEMIYKVMERIVSQEIPFEVINDDTYDWAPFSNKVWKDGKEVDFHKEGGARYAHILDIFHSYQQSDPYHPQLPTEIERNFEGSMELSAAEIEDLFVRLISSEQIREVARLIQTRLGRELRPYDIWYDGFKGRSTMSEDELSALTRKRYPNTESFKDDMPRMLKELGFSDTYARFITSKIEVEAAVGSGHAQPSMGRGFHSFLRTRIGSTGMDYKGYNIAVHEFGHNVEETIDLYDIDYYTLSGVPNTAYTEALAFVLQKRDLQLLGFDSSMDDNTTLDLFWGMYEIMGVSLVDMYMWRWLYANPSATAEELMDSCLGIAKEVWNRYFEPVMGTHDSPLLAIYSHMVNAPMYLPNYPFGTIIEYQLEEHFSKLPDPSRIGDEIIRIYRLGRLTPQIWMKEAVGSTVSIDPVLKAVDRILN